MSKTAMEMNDSLCNPHRRLRHSLLLFVTTTTCVAYLSATRGAETPAATAFAKWKQGPPPDARYFPIAVWLQDPKNAPKFKAAGINLYVGLWKGPTESQLSALKDAGMPVICAQNEFGLAHKRDPTIVGWMHNDEPDNAQTIVDPTTGKKGYGGPVPPPRVVSDYEKMRTADPTRPILLNLGQGIANDEWRGRGKGAHRDDYLTYVQGADIVSFDVYPVAGIDKPDGENYLWYVAKGVDRLAKWSEGKKIVWNCLECTRISNEKVKPTPPQVRAEAWMSLIHGSTGLIYFVHQFKPRFIEAALLEDSEMLAGVTKLNKEIQHLAPVLNSSTPQDAATVRSSSADVPIDLMAKRYQGATYLFAVGMRNAPARGSFELRGSQRSASVQVLGEARSVAMKSGKFEDEFQPYDVRLYRIQDQ